VGTSQAHKKFIEGTTIRKQAKENKAKRYRLIPLITSRNSSKEPGVVETRILKPG
jgi:hypothetical protein